MNTATWRQEAAVLPYALSLLPTAMVVAGNLAGGYAAAAYAVFALVGLVLLDWLLPARYTRPLPPQLAMPTVVLLLAVACHTAAVFSLLYAVYAGILTGKFLVFAAVSTGFNTGILGITAAHELIHRRERWLQSLGIWNLFLANYTHFHIEHRLGHHLRVGTWDDPVTARYNEGYYRFVARAIPGQVRSAWQIEAKRLA
ncbi:MAG: fatty acid desaturase, partial [Cytophagales bacterium]|nr:fatty acid desaturase [Cytophagales bacterium]